MKGLRVGSTIYRVRYVISTLCVATLLCSMYRGMFYRSLHKQPHILLSLPSFIDKQEHDDIKTFLQQKGCFLNEETIKNLTYQFPYLYDIELAAYTQDSIHISAQAHNILSILNNEWLLLNNQSIVTTSIYKDWFYENKPHITILDEDFFHELTTKEINALHQLSPDLLNNYQCLWLNETDAFLHDKQQNRQVIRFNADSIPTTKIITYCQTILQEQAVKEKRWKKRHLVADIRFSNQIIFYSCQEGECYGQHFIN